MAGRMSKQKGMRGEYEVRDLLQAVVNRVYAAAAVTAPVLERNLEQTRKGGADLIGLPWLALEVKYREQLNLEAWWKQAKDQALEGQTPVLIHRCNHALWRVRMFGNLSTRTNRVKCPVDISLEAFLVWFELKVKEELR